MAHKISPIISFLTFFCILNAIVSCKLDADTNYPDQKAMDQYMKDYTAPTIKWGFIDKMGNLQIDNKFDDVRDFEDGLALASFEGKWGFINKKGKPTIPFRYLDARAFHDGLALVSQFDHMKYYIDKQNKKICDCHYEKCLDFKNGIAVVGNDQSYGLIDKQGKVILDPIYNSVTPIDSQTVILQQKEKYGIFHLLTKKWLVEPSFDKIYTPQHGFYRVIKVDKTGFISHQDYKLWPKWFEEATDVENGYAAVQSPKGWTLLSMKTNKTLPIPDATVVQSGGEGTWMVNEKNSWHFIDTLGIKISENYDNLLRFSNGLAGVNTYEQWGYIDLHGKEVIPPTLPIIWDFKENVVRIITPSGFTFIDRLGNPLFDKSFEEARDFQNNLARVGF